MILVDDVARDDVAREEEDVPSAGNYVAEDVTETCVVGSAAADPHRCL